MDRRAFIKASAAAATAAAAGGAAHASSSDAVSPRGLHHCADAETIDLRAAMSWAEGFSGGADASSRLMQRIESASRGRFKIAPAVPASEAADVLARDIADIHLGPGDSVISTNPVLAYFSGLPYDTGLGPDGLEAWLLVGGGQALWDEAVAPLGYKMLLAGHLGEGPGLRSRTPIGSLADLKGMSVYSPGLGGLVIEALGASAKRLRPSVLRDALQTGAIDAVEWGGSLADHASGLAQATTHVTQLNINGAGHAVWLTLPLEFWQALSDGERALIEAEAGYAFRLSLAEARGHEAMMRDVIARGLAVKTLPPPADGLGGIASIAPAIVADLAGRDQLSRRINASYMAFKSAWETENPRLGGDKVA